MDLPPALLQFLGSLAGIFLLAAIALWLKLGPSPKLASEEEARFAADEVISGFDPVEIGLDCEGRGAIMRDAEGRLLLLRPHGTHFAGRMLTPSARMEMEGDELLVDTAEKRFGAARLTLDNPSAWTQALDALG